MNVGFFSLRDKFKQPTASKQSVLYQEDKVTTYESWEGSRKWGTRKYSVPSLKWEDRNETKPYINKTSPLCVCAAEKRAAAAGRGSVRRPKDATQQTDGLGQEPRRGVHVLRMRAANFKRI
jgi:hypothetical protein